MEMRVSFLNFTKLKRKKILELLLISFLQSPREVDFTENLKAVAVFLMVPKNYNTAGRKLKGY